jgi:hypothetical protein
MGKLTPALDELMRYEAALKEPRWHGVGESRYMAHADGYVMVRRPHCMPYVMAEKEWLALPSAQFGREYANQYNAALSPTPSIPSTHGSETP